MPRKTPVPALELPDIELQASRLREARKLRGFKSASLAAQRFGWPVPTYVSHENGTRGIGRRYQEYAKQFRVNPAWLLGHSAERAAPDQETATLIAKLEAKIDKLANQIAEILQRLPPKH
jgi:hypothetical protein